jgi:hypothetical protein
LLKTFLERAKPAFVGIGTGRNTKRPFEDALEMKRAHPDLLTEAVQPDWFFEIVLDESARSQHDIGVD